MSYPNLTKFLDQINWMCQFTKQDPILMENIDAKVAKDLYHRIDGDLSPENLCCDGELPPAQVRVKERMLRGAARELEQMGFGRPDGLYCL